MTVMPLVLGAVRYEKMVGQAWGETGERPGRGRGETGKDNDEGAKS